MYCKGFELLFNDTLVEISFEQIFSDPGKFLNNVLTLMEQRRASLGTFQLLLLEMHRSHVNAEFENTLSRIVRFASDNRLTQPYVDDRSGYLHLCMLAASFYMEKLRSVSHATTNDGERQQLSEQWVQLLNTLFAQFDAEEHTHAKLQSYLFTTTLAQFYILKGSFKAANQLTSRWCDQHPSNVSVLLVHALSLYLLKDYARALETYQFILLLAPRADVPVRYAIGLCLAQLGHPEAAIIAFDRQLEVTKDHVDSLVHSAVIQLNWFKTKAHIGDQERLLYLQSAVDYLSKALSIEKRHPVAQWLLAEVYCFRSLPKHSQLLSNQAYDITDRANVGLNADALFTLGKSLHVAGEYESSLALYDQSLQLVPDTPHVLYALAQVSLAVKDQPRALSALENIESRRFSIEACTLLASLYLSHEASRSRGKSLLGALQRHYGVDLHSLSKKNAQQLSASFVPISDILLLALLAEQLETTNVKAALVVYESLETVYRQLGYTKQEMPLEIFANRACLLYRDSQLDDAKSVYGDILETRFGLRKEEIADDKLDSVLSAKTEESYKATAVLFSYGRLLETLGDSEKSKMIYSAIKRNHPAYLDAALRLGVLLNKEQQFTKGMEQLEEILEQNPKHAVTHLLIAYASMLRKEYRKARKQFEAAMTIRPNDEYALCGIGHIFVETSRMATTSLDCEQLLKSAFHVFTERCLKHNADNAYAVNGLGMVFAERKMYAEAAHIFSQLRQLGKTTQGSSYRLEWLASFNYGATVMELGKYSEAITTFETMIRRTDDPMDYILFQSVARGYYLRAREFKELSKHTSNIHDLKRRTFSDIITTCKYLQRAIHCVGRGGYPGMLYIDLAMALQYYAELVGRYLPLNTLNRGDLATGRLYLRQSRALFTKVVEIASSESEQKPASPDWTFMVNVKVGQDRVTVCDDLGERLDRRTGELEAVERTHEEKVSQALAQQKAQLELQALERRKQLEAERRNQLEREERQRLLEEQFKSRASTNTKPISDSDASDNEAKTRVSKRPTKNLKKRKDAGAESSRPEPADPSKYSLSEEFVKDSESEGEKVEDDDSDSVESANKPERLSSSPKRAKV